MKYPLYLALRYLKSRPLSYLAVAAIALSLGTMLTNLYVMWGLTEQVQKMARGIIPDLRVQSRDVYGIVDYEGLLGEVRGLPEVAQASPILTGWVFVQKGRMYAPAQMMGIDADSYDGVTPLAPWFGGERPSFESEPGARPPAHVGARLKWDLWSGDQGILDLGAPVFSSPSGITPGYPTLSKAKFR